MHTTTILIHLHLQHNSPMETSAPQVMRASIFTLLKDFSFFTSTPSLLALPFALSTLLVSSFASSSHLFPFVHDRVTSLFLAGGIPRASTMVAVLTVKLSQTILSSFLVSPFALSSLLLTKATVVRALQHNRNEPVQKGSLFSWIVPFKPLFITHLCNSLLILMSNATCFCLLVLFYNGGKVLGLSSRGTLMGLGPMLAMVYSIVLANAYVLCNLSLILSALERHGGFCLILKAWALLQGRIAAALSLSLPINVALAAIEALFQYRVMRAYHQSMSPSSSVILEAMLLAYLYAVLVVLDTIVGTVFLKSCRQDHRTGHGDMYSYHIEIQQRDDAYFERMKEFTDGVIIM